MAVIMVVGNVQQIQFSLFATGATIPSAIALGLNESGGLQRSALVALGVILLLVTIVVNCLARLLIWRVGRVKPAAGGPASLGQGLGVLFRYALAGAGLLLLGFLAHRLVVALSGNPAGWPTSSPLVNTVLLAAAALGCILGVRYAVRRSRWNSQWTDRLMTGTLGLSLAITLVPLFLILGYITLRGVTALDWNFFTRLPNDEPAGLGHALYGSAVLVGLASMFAVPLGILAAIFLAEYRGSRLAPAVRFVGELLGGVPSIVIGIFAYALLVRPAFLDRALGFTAWAGAFALGVMMIPIVMRAAEEALKLVPQSLRHASYALGAAQWQTVLRVTVPAALPAIITGVCLAIARIAGETAPLLLTVNQTAYWPKTLNQDFPFLTYYIYNYSQSSNSEQGLEEQRLAWAAAFVLLVVIMAVNVGIRFLTGRRVVLASRAG
jgi:phosphate transport system permease protein